MFNDAKLFLAGLITLVITVAFLLVLRPVAKVSGLVDRPGGRKKHHGSVPIIGGIAMFIGILAGLAVMGVADRLVVSFAFSVFILALVGVVDDVLHVRPAARILVQVAAIIIMAYGGGLMLFSLGNPFGLGEILLGQFALIGTLMVGITVINAFNLVDGADGLAGTLVLIPLVAVILIVGIGEPSAALPTIVAAAVLAFLFFNFPIKANRPIRTFMGDAGSIVLGFVVFWAVLGVSQGEEAIISPVAGLWFAAIPIFDTLTCFVRRVRKGKSPFKPGRDHFHHMLVRGGFHMREKLAILCGLQLIYTIIGATSGLLGVPDVILFVAWSALGMTQFKVIRLVSTRHRRYLFNKLRAGELSPELSLIHI